VGRTAYFAARDHAFQHLRDGEIGVNPVFQQATRKIFTRMKLFHVLTTPVSLGFLTRQAAFMQGQGVNLHVVSSPGPGLKEFGECEGVETHAVLMERKISPLRDIGSIFQLFALFRRERPDVVHAHTPKASLVAMIAATIAGVRCRFFHIHGLPHSTAAGFSRSILLWSTKVCSRLATRVICVSQSLAATSVEEGLCRAEKLGVFGHGSINGVDATGLFYPSKYEHLQPKAMLGFEDKDLVIGFAGRLVRDKGVYELCEAWSQIREEFPNAHLLIAGQMEERDALPDLIVRKLKSDERVRMLGHFGDMPMFYAALDVLALPTHREGLGMVILESAAMEVPSVASRCVGCVDAVVDGVTGLLVTPGDPAALAEALREYLNNPDLRKQHGTAARTRVLRDFRPEDVWEATLNEYRTAMRFAERHAGSPITRISKRGLDIAVSLMGLVGLAPLLAIVALFVRLHMGSPVLFRQRRPGRGERPFTMLKFRTMRDAYDASGRLLPDGERLTSFGKFLRRTSLDELPELWNVLKGDMSLVGPRPLLFQYVEYFSEDERQRALVRPGITGWAQVHGRNLCGWDERLARDLRYVQNLSFRLDLRILFMTLCQVVRSKDVIEDPRTFMLNLDEERRLRAAKV
jgi:lipopolysaccharide/colanic/teichoic acid biosynthesis glycosyltransferase